MVRRFYILDKNLLNGEAGFMPNFRTALRLFLLTSIFLRILISFAYMAKNIKELTSRT